MLAGASAQSPDPGLTVQSIAEEVDAIVQATDGRWAVFEIKLGPAHVDSAAARLMKFAAQIDTSKSGSPASLGVIVGSGYGYTRKDGIHVIPIGTLGS